MKPLSLLTPAFLAEQDLTLNTSFNRDAVLPELLPELHPELAGSALTGTNGKDVLTGGDGDDTLYGLRNADTLNGGAGADLLVGGLGNDVYLVDDLGDQTLEQSNAGKDSVQASLSWTLGANVENLSLLGTADLDGTGNSINNALTGNSGNNHLIGNEGHDTLNGGAGADTLEGGAGNDVYFVDSVADVAIEVAGPGNDLVKSSVSWTLGDNLEALQLLTGQDLSGTGNAGSNRITGNSGHNLLSGNAGHDTLDGGAGADTLVGGTGNDVFVVESSADVVTELAKQGTDRVEASLDWTLGANLENLTLTSSADLNGTGNELANVLLGNAGANVLSGAAGNDTLDGGAGADTLAGGTGDDSFLVDNSGDVVSELAGEGADTVQASVSYTLAAEVENLRLLGTADLSGTGNTLANQISGNAGNNTLDGGAGADTLAGGAGNDVYVVDDAGDTVTELAGEGTDGVQASISYTLNAEVENLTLLGTEDLSGTGNDLDNLLTGNSGANNLVGAEGNDTFVGDLGNDTFTGGKGDDTYYLETGDLVVESIDGGIDTLVSSLNNISLNATLKNLFLTGAANLSGYGNLANNLIIGNTGNNTLYGDADFAHSASNDTLLGGDGNDYLYGSSHNGNYDSGNDYLVGGSGNDILSGDAGQDTLDGGIGNDFLNEYGYNDGGYHASADTFVFGKGYGNDTLYNYDDPSMPADTDTILLNASVDAAEVSLARDWSHNNGIDLVLSIAGTTDTLRAQSFFYSSSNQIEQIQFSDGSIWNSVDILAKTLIGDSGTNLLVGYATDDQLFGHEGHDSLYGDDNYVSGSSNDSLWGGDGNDYLFGGSYSDGYDYDTGDDFLSGGSGNDTLNGDAGNDTLDGGSGDDYLGDLGNNYGYSSGADTFIFGKGYGNDTLYSYDNPSSADVDTLSLNFGVSASEIILSRDWSHNDSDLVLSIAGTTDTLRIQYFFSDSSYQIEQIQFADGSVWDLADILAKTLIGSSDADRLVGYASHDQLFGYGGNDTLYGDDAYASNASNDTLVGGDGNDYLYGGSYNADYEIGKDYLNGGAGNDTLSGGDGNDTLDGGDGNDYLIDDGNYANGGGAFSTSDTFVFGKGGGNDTLYSYDDASVGASSDILQLSSGVSASEITLVRDWKTSGGSDLVLGISGTTDTLRMQYFFSDSSYQIEQFQFADGTTWNLSDILATLNGTASTAAGDDIFGS